MTTGGSTPYVVMSMLVSPSIATPWPPGVRVTGIVIAWVTSWIVSVPLARTRGPAGS